MAVTNAQRVQLALQIVARGLGPYIDARLTRAHGEDWPQHVAHSVPRNAKEDPHFLLTAMIRVWRDAGFHDALGHSGRSWVGELLDARNRWAHNEGFSGDQAYRAIDTAKLLLDAVGAGELGAELDTLRQDLLRTRFSEEQRRVRRRVAGRPTEGAPIAGLKPWREVVTPHPDVASGRYAQAEFAADLHQVWRGDATPEYGDPAEFFRRTFLTEGLRSLLVNAVRRLGGEGGNPVIELQTNFGGGKTHSLIALLHLAAGLPAADLPGVE
ncbi:MAG: Swt1 family HEPN domain-containing protein, partial [Solirubrobacteraceae bacterium]